MRLPFWKNKVSVEEFHTHSPLPLLVEDDKNSFSSWKTELPYDKYKSVELNTFAIPSKTKIKDIIINLEINIYIQAAIQAAMQVILQDRMLKNSYRFLDNLHKECEEEGFQRFSEIAKKNAKQILSFIYNEFPNYNYHIYPTEDREIAINCNPQKGKGILVLCDSNGGIACFATFEGKNRRFRYDSIDNFSYRLLCETFEELDIEKKHSFKFLYETFEELDIEKKHSLTSPSSRDSFVVLKKELDHQQFFYRKTYN